MWDAGEDFEARLEPDAHLLPASFGYSPAEKDALVATSAKRQSGSWSAPEDTPWWRLACRHRLLCADEEKALATRIQAGDEAALVQLVECNYRLVVRVATRYQRVRSRALMLEDLFQEGCIGLMHAARKFDPKRAVRFSTYAVPWVQQSMARAIMRQERLVRLPEGLEREQQAVERTISNLTQSLGRRPSHAEIASSLSEASRALVAHPVNFDFVSLDAPISTRVDSDSWADILPDEYTDTASDAIDTTTRDVMSSHIARAMGALTQQQATVIRLRYGFGQPPLTLSAIATMLEVTPERVRQLERTALRNMRRNEHMASLEQDTLVASCN